MAGEAGACQLSVSFTCHSSLPQRSNLPYTGRIDVIIWYDLSVHINLFWPKLQNLTVLVPFKRYVVPQCQPPWNSEDTLKHILSGNFKKQKVTALI